MKVTFLAACVGLLASAASAIPHEDQYYGKQCPTTKWKVAWKTTTRTKTVTATRTKYAGYGYSYITKTVTQTVPSKPYTVTVTVPTTVELPGEQTTVTIPGAGEITTVTVSTTLPCTEEQLTVIDDNHGVEIHYPCQLHVGRVSGGRIIGGHMYCFQTDW
ncbi:hypothetical protein FN846DRAFT_894787 [Sphaerosporella brunnea]|uniref:Uncharacterized protein n=1 Tax=Sphaerosporella brunnea TaxID=1250544 RepID=A0A5J5EGB3_9PEZI|nr:hypothetical protein FN846DRAFT_894787 [Sphaerosporella brunnea]